MFKQHSESVSQTLIVPIIESKPHKLWQTFQKIFGVAGFDRVEEFQSSEASSSVGEPEPGQGFEICIRLKSICGPCFCYATVEGQRERATLRLEK